MRLLIKILLVSFFIVPCLTIHSQDSIISISSFEGYKELPGALGVWQPDKQVNSVTEVDINQFSFSSPEQHLNERNFFKPRWFLLQLYYEGDQPYETIYFYPGKMVNASVYRYDSSSGSWQYISKREAFSSISLSSKIGLVPLRVQKGKVQPFLVQPDLHYYNWTQWNPTIAQTLAVNDLILHEFIQPNYTYSILTILMAGMMFMLFSYSILKFYLNRRNEYLYNSLFALAFLLFFTAVFVSNFYYQIWWHKYSPFFLYWIQVVGFMMQFVFIISFLELREKNRHLFLLLRGVILGLLAYSFLLPFLSLSDQLYTFNILLFDIILILTILVGIYTAVRLYQWHNYIARYTATGLISLACFLALIIIQNTLLNENLYLVMKVGGSIILYHGGILATLFFFRLGLGHKERIEELQKLEDIEKLRLENEKKELEKVLAIASSRVEERNRIAKEIHDDIGSGLTSIRLLSEIALMKEPNKSELSKISANANELVNNLNEIIWSINSKNDTLPNLLAYIRSHMVDYLEPYNIKLSINLPPDIPNLEISGEKRRNIFMIVKECFTNIIKHANATAVNFTVQVRDQLIFTIKDNGKGFESKDILPFKNGIRNMKERIEHIGGEIDISGKSGTTITVKFSLNGNNS